MGTRLLVTIAAAGFSVVATACGSSTAPLTNPGLLAAHFDSLATAAYCNQPGFAGNNLECRLIFSAEMGVAEGVAPTLIRVTTSAGSGSWLGYVYLYQSAGRVAGSIDSVYTIVAYDNDNLTNEVVFDVPVVDDGAALARIDSTYWGAPDGSESGGGAATVISTGSSCTLTDTGPYRPPIDQAHCRKASIRASGDVTFRVAFTNDSTTISIPSQTMNGFVLDTGAIYMRSHDARISGKVR